MGNKRGRVGVMQAGPTAWPLTGLVLVLASLAFGTAVRAQAPLSAIDWLTRSAPVPVVQPPQRGQTPRQASPAATPETPVSQSAATPTVTVQSLAAPSVDAAGLLAPSVTGLPATLWSGSSTDDLVARLTQTRVEAFPAMQSLLYTLLLAEAEPPRDATPQARFLQARIDTLMGMGAVEPALAMLDPLATRHPALFARWFDLTLLTGQEDRACAAMIVHPALAPGWAARVYCTARAGDWQTAALTFATARTLGLLGHTEQAMLERFLDPELFEDAQVPLPPVRPSVLLFRLYEAIGEPLPTAPLPRAFSVADLRDTAGWKAQIEAAERLARAGALSENRLISLYTERAPAASGGVWDRVAAVQRFDEALRAGEPGSVAVALPQLWANVAAARLEDAFARAYGAALQDLPLTGGAADLAYRVALLSPNYEAAAQARGAQFPGLVFETGVARGMPPPAAPGDEIAAAIAAGFAAATPPADVQAAVAAGRLGEAILIAMQRFQTGAAGEPVALREALAAFRALGLEDTARRAALQVRLLRRGL